MKFKVYVDYTTEQEPRPFYVGKGNDARIADLKRNKLHSSIVKKYGIERKVVFETDDEQEALATEVKLIAEYKTFVSRELESDDHWGANLTMGGEGISGWLHSEESKKKNSESNKLSCAGELNGMFGKKHSEETRRKIGEKSKGRIDSLETRKKKSDAGKICNKGRKMSLEAKKKMSESRKGKPPWNKGKKLGKRKIKRTFSEQARKNMSEARKGKIPWNKGLKKNKVQNQ